MNKIKLVPFKVEHLDLMDIREHELTGIFTIKNLKERLSKLEKICTAGTIVYEGRILGVMGSLELWPGVCEVWVIPSIHIKRYSLIFAKIVKRNLKNLEETFDYHRVQVTALDDELHKHWLTFLGFKCEGILRKYTLKKQDFAMWSRIKDGT